MIHQLLSSGDVEKNAGVKNGDKFPLGSAAQTAAGICNVLEESAISDRAMWKLG